MCQLVDNRLIALCDWAQGFSAMFFLAHIVAPGAASPGPEPVGAPISAYDISASWPETI